MIVFSGLDGAGKSTQINLLTNLYNKLGTKNIVFWSRGGYTPGMVFIKNLFMNKNNYFDKNDDLKKSIRKKQFSKPIVRKAWLVLSILDLIFYYCFYIRIKEFFNVKVICDRYIFDTLVDFRLNFPQENVEIWWLWKILIFFAVKPEKHFVLTVSVKESLQRSKLKKEPFPDSKKTLENRLNNYLIFVSDNKKIVHIEGDNDIKLIHKLIIKKLQI